MSKLQERVEIGIIGCGNISGAYLKACRAFDILHVSAVADLDAARAQAKAQEFSVPRALSVDAMLADPDIEIIVNLTIPRAHAEVSRAILEAGKSVYSEKPLAIDREQARALLDLAGERDLRVGCAPDTFLGGGLQTCRGVLDSGMIGRPIAATAFMLSHGPESWHPDPAFFYEDGAGPLFDMGPYYLTALISLLGPVVSVTGSAVVSMKERTITSKPLAGKVIEPKTPTHVTGLLDFANGAVATLTTSFDVWASEHPRLEIYGTEGTLSLPDPNTFGGVVRVKLAGEKTWQEIELTHGYTENSRGIGVADQAYATRAGKPHRASGRLAFHVLDIMQSILESAEAKRVIQLQSACERPEPLPSGTTDDPLASAWSERDASHA